MSLHARPFYHPALYRRPVFDPFKKDKEFAYTNLPRIEKLFRVMTQKTHVALQRRMIDNLSKTTEQQYVEFSVKYPQLLQRLSNIQVAAYLGITNVFLRNLLTNISQEK